MSCMNLRRLLPPMKVWKLFTKKLQIKINKTRAIKKSNKRASKKLGWTWALSIQPKKFKPKLKSRVLIHHCKKRPAPVYVDKLFIEPVSVVEKYSEKEKAIKINEKTCPSSSSRSVYERNCEGEKIGKEGDDDRNLNSTADDMWESLALGTPHDEMQDIDRRAEEFIASFRAEMQQQEILARRFL